MQFARIFQYAIVLTSFAGVGVAGCGMDAEPIVEEPVAESEQGIFVGCKGSGASCTADLQCCAQRCTGGYCSCRPVAVACTQGPDCCTGICVSGRCAAPPACMPNLSTCTGNGQCCSGLCLGICTQITSIPKAGA